MSSENEQSESPEASSPSKNSSGYYFDFPNEKRRFPYGFPSNQSAENIDASVRRLDIVASSEKVYGEITMRIIDITDAHLRTVIEEKKSIRRKTSSFIRSFLMLQLVLLLVFILLSSLKCFAISDTVITTYIISVVAETISGFVAIIYFAFSNKQETKLIGILNRIVDKFQKFTEIVKDMDKKHRKANPKRHS